MYGSYGCDFYIQYYIFTYLHTTKIIENHLGKYTIWANFSTTCRGQVTPLVITKEIHEIIPKNAQQIQV